MDKSLVVRFYGLQHISVLCHLYTKPLHQLETHTVCSVNYINCLMCKVVEDARRKTEWTCQHCTSMIHVNIAKICWVVYCWCIHVSCSTITNWWLLLLLLLLLLRVKRLEWDGANDGSFPLLAILHSAKVPRPGILHDSWTFKAAAVSWPVGMNGTIKSTSAGLRPIQSSRLTHQADVKISLGVERTVAWRAHATSKHRQRTHAQRSEKQLMSLKIWSPKCYT